MLRRGKSIDLIYLNRIYRMISVIFGLGGQGREAMDVLLGQNHAPHELLFCESEPTEKSIHGIDIISFSQLISMKPEISSVHVALGSTIDRKFFVDTFRSESFSLLSIESNKSSISKFAVLGGNAFISDFSFIGPDVSIGDGVLVNYMASISHDSVLGDFVTVGPGARVNGHVIVGNDVFIGSNAVIRNGTKSDPLVIGDSAIIGAGAVVTKNVPAGTTIVGNPGRRLA